MNARVKICAAKMFFSKPMPLFISATIPVPFSVYNWNSDLWLFLAIWILICSDKSALPKMVACNADEMYEKAEDD